MTKQMLTAMAAGIALMAAALAPIWLFTFDHGRMLILVLILTILIYIRHGANLGRLKAGTEPKIGQKKPQG